MLSSADFRLSLAKALGKLQPDSFAEYADNVTKCAIYVSI